MYCTRTIQKLKDELLEKQNEALELRFELEQASNQKNRMQKQLEDLESFQKLVLDTNESQLLRGQEKKTDNQKTKDMEGVIEALKRLVEKLRNENDGLKRNSASHAELNQIKDTAKKWRERANQAEKQIKQLQQLQHETQNQAEDAKRLQNELDSLKKQMQGLRKEKEMLSSSLKMAEELKNNLEKELLDARNMVVNRIEAIEQDPPRVISGQAFDFGEISSLRIENTRLQVNFHCFIRYLKSKIKHSI